MKLFRAKKLANARLGIVVDVWKHYPARPGNNEDEAMALAANEIAGFGWFLHPLFLGGYSEELTEYMKKNGFTPDILEGDFATISQPVDFYGLNFYNGLYDNADEARRIRELEASGGNYQERPEQHPEAIYDVLHMLVEKYRIKVPIYVTENGYIQLDEDNGKKEDFQIKENELLEKQKINLNF